MLSNSSSTLIYKTIKFKNAILEIAFCTLMNLSPLNLERQAYWVYEENWAQWPR